MSNKILKIIISGGGTGGHLFPAIAIADILKKNHHKIIYIGSKHGIEAKTNFFSENESYLINIKGLARTLTIKNIASNFILPLRIIVSLYSVSKIINRSKPDVIIGTGGYASIIPLWLGIRKNIKTIIQEQNVLPGMVTKLLEKKVDLLFLSFDESKNYIKNKKSITVGNPIRSSISLTDKNIARKMLDIDNDKFTIFIIGGSQGATPINNHINDNINFYLDNDIQLIWQTGKNDYNKIKIKYKACKTIKVYDFIKDIKIQYNSADLIVSRAGATAISEMIFLRKPSILIPYPQAANNHQVLNAKLLSDKDASIMIGQHELGLNILEKNILKLKESKDSLIKMKKEIDRIGHYNTEFEIINAIKQITDQND